MNDKRNNEKPVKILFICLGNICRSPAADGVMRHLVKESGREADFVIDSAGTGGWHVGELPDSRMRACGARHGYKFDHRARQFSRDDFSDFDLLVVMDNGNYRVVSNMAHTDEEREKIVMLADYMRNHKGQTTIPDPYYGSDRDFEFALELIEDACQGLLDALSN